MIVPVRFRSGVAAQWTLYNPTLGDGELGFERDSNHFKIGNGTDPWSDLEYYGAGGGGSGVAINSELVLEAVSDFFTHVTVQNDGTDSANWPNRMSFEYKPNTGDDIGRHLTGWFNEYGEFRVTPAKANTVPFRSFTKELDTDAEHDAATPVMEMVWCRNVRTAIWGVMADGTMYTAGPIERRVPSGPTLKTGYLPLATAAAIPAGTPAGTLIVRF